ncbi:DNA adenine methylase [Pedobacter sp. Du54]|uniref:DNA adenine methylase n=1 Tax=Pedobacter anseongensis TaxID=3133439 RepID=UPI0030AEFB1A
MKKKLRPLVKWTGGKFDEFAFFCSYIPTFSRYIEPFFGGGGVFFALQPQVPALINDKSTDLINFYREIENEAFKDELFLYADAWDELGRLTVFLWEKCGHSFVEFIENRAMESQFKEELEQNVAFFLTAKSALCDVDFMVDVALFETIILSSIADKANRIKRISPKENRSFTEDELYAHFETGVRSGGYLFFRKLLNQHFRNFIHLTPAKAAANWYFVREFCYASMFRFNANGEFNIPYGGIAYNKKKFREKAERIFTNEVANLFKKTTISNQDFELFLTEVKPVADDFIFLDPPYDSEFSEYDQSAFNKQDQTRLANFLFSTPAKWMVVIKETPFIRNLYTHPAITIATFEKNYTYNVRGRNNRGVTHLIITNF